MKFLILDYDQKTSAKMTCDKHIKSLPSETCQILCNVIHKLYPNRKDIPFNSYNSNHPATNWVLESKDNYIWLMDMLYYYRKEYTRRFGKQHKTTQTFEWLRDNSPYNLKNFGVTGFPLLMPIKYKSDDIVQSYRKYYIGEKSNMLNYTNRRKPNWI